MKLKEGYKINEKFQEIDHILKRHEFRRIALERGYNDPERLEKTNFFNSLNLRK